MVMLFDPVGSNLLDVRDMQVRIHSDRNTGHRSEFMSCRLHRHFLQIMLLLIMPSSAWGQGYSPSEAVSRMKMADGLEATLFASEPEVRQPIFCKCDERGRLWTIQYLQYPNPAGLKRVKVDRFSRTEYDRKPEPPPKGPRGADRITILEDTNGDGRADRFHDFIDGLNLCTGVEFGNGGVYVIQAPYLLFYPDRDRNDVPDSDPEVLLDGFGFEDAQSLANHLTWGPDGWLYGLNGSTTTCRIRGIEFQQGVWRYHPVTRDFELFCEGGGNVYGLTFDRAGRLFYSSNGGVFYHGLQGAYYEKNFGKHGPLHNPFAYGYLKHVPVNGQTGRPNTGATIYTGDSFPSPFHGAFLCGDFLTHTCSSWTVSPTGATVRADLQGLWLQSNDTWFGATDLCAGPSGEMYVCDFHDARTAHPDPDAKWDTSNGRIYRVQAQGLKSKAPVDLAQQTTEELIELLKSPNGWNAQQARRILADRRDPGVRSRLFEMAMQDNNPDDALQALWAAAGCGFFDDALALSLISHSDEHVRTWAVRLCGDRRSVSSESAAALAKMAQQDASVIVRSQLAATAGRLPGKDGLPILFALLDRGLDRDDPCVPWQIWWSLVEHSTKERELILRTMSDQKKWQKSSYRDDLLRLVRRYSAEATADGYASCLTLLKSSEEIAADQALQAALQGLRERPSAERLPVTDDLKSWCESYWKQRPDNELRLRVALECESGSAKEYLLSQLKGDQPGDSLQSSLKISEDYGDQTFVSVQLQLAVHHKDDSVRSAALKALRRFVTPEVTSPILEAYSSMSMPLQSVAREVLFRHPDSVLAFLELVDQKTIKAASVPLEELRALALFGNPEIDQLVRRHWGNLSPGTPEEKLADIRRFNNDLRAASGDAANGRLVFRKQCASCHRMDGEGIAIGPDISGTVRGDTQSLLTNLVDPGSFIRMEYLTYVIVTQSGSVLSGLIAEQDAASLTLVDGKNQRTRISRDQIEEMTESTTSLMPEKLLEPLSPQELRDLFAYLQGPHDSGSTPKP